MRNECSADNFVCFLVGVAVGSGAALLMAPQSGKRTRRQIARRAEDAQDHLEELGEELIAKGRELVERGRAEVEQKLRRPEA